MVIMILQIQFIPETSIAKSIAIARHAILNKVSRDADSDITLKEYCNANSDTEKNIGDTKAITILYCNFNNPDDDDR